jgi:FkbM family methyltransferase
MRSIVLVKNENVSLSQVKNFTRMNFKSRVKAFYKSLVFKLSASNSFIFLAFYRYFYRPVPGSIDEFTSRFSEQREKITVVQIGANDGINNDPIHKFIKRDNWQGVLLEPQKYVFENFLRPLYRKTKGITVLNAALDIKDGSKPIYKIAVSNSRWATGLTSFSRAVLEEKVESGDIERQAKKEGTPLPENKNDFIAEEQVECICTDTLVKKYCPGKIDWLQIDTEGFDFEIIKMFDIDRTRPEVIVYENIHFTDALKKECSNYLKDHGYLCKDFGPNSMAMRKPAAGFEDLFT